MSSRIRRVLRLPILPIRNTVIFPVLAFPINVGRKKSIGAVDSALNNDKYMAIFAQRDPSKDDPQEYDLYEIGSMIKIIKHVKMPGNKLSVVIQGVSRIRLLRVEIAWSARAKIPQAPIPSRRS